MQASDVENIQPFNIRSGVMVQLVTLYKLKTAAIREGCANALDQYQHKDAAQRMKVIGLSLFQYMKDGKVCYDLRIRDNATGIQKGKMKDFTDVGNVDTNLSTGKEVGDLISSYENVNPDIAGLMHIGKAALLGASKIHKVEYRSNNGIEGHYLEMRMNGWKIFEDGTVFDTIVPKEKALPKIGLEIKIVDVIDELNTIQKVAAAVSEYMGLLIERGKVEVHVLNDNNPSEHIIVKPDEDYYHKSEKTLFTVEDEKGNKLPVKGVTWGSDDVKSYVPNLKIMWKHYYVKKVIKPFLCRGWINFDYFFMTASKEEIRADKLYENFEKGLNEYLEKYYKRTGETQEKVKDQDLKKVKDYANKALSIMANFCPELSLEVYGLRSKVGVPGTIEEEIVNEGFIDWELETGDINPNGVVEGKPVDTSHGRKKRKIKKPRIQTGNGSSNGETTTFDINQNGHTQQSVGMPRQRQVTIQHEKQLEIIKPEISPEYTEAGNHCPTVFMRDAKTLIINTSTALGRRLRPTASREIREKNLLFDRIVRALMLFAGKKN